MRKKLDYRHEKWQWQNGNQTERWGLRQGIFLKLNRATESRSLVLMISLGKIFYSICILLKKQAQQFSGVIMSFLSMLLNKSNLGLNSNSWFKEQIEFIEHFIRAFLVASHLWGASFDLYTVINQIARARENSSKQMETYFWVISYSGDWSVSYFFIFFCSLPFQLYIFILLSKNLQVENA